MSRIKAAHGRSLTNLEHASANVIASWEGGDLAGAVNQLSEALEASLMVDMDCNCDERSWHGDYHDSACPYSGERR